MISVDIFRNYPLEAPEVAASIFATVASDMENKDQMMKIFLSKLIKPGRGHGLFYSHGQTHDSSTIF